MKSLGIRIAVVISIVLFVLLMFIGVAIDRRLTQSVYNDEFDYALSHARSMLASLRTLMLNGQGTLARKWLDNMRDEPDILDIAVLRKNGEEAFTDLDTVRAVNEFLEEKRFSREARSSVQSLLEPEPVPGRDYFFREPAPVASERPLKTRAFERSLQGEPAFDQGTPGILTVYMPISNDKECLACHGYDVSSLRGVLKLSVSTVAANSHIDAMRGQLWQSATVLVVLIGVALWLALRFSVMRPITRITTALRRVGQGDRTARLSEVRRDELGLVARVFNQMQDRLLRSEGRARAVMDNVVDAIVTVDGKGRIESANPAVRSLFGYTAEQLKGRRLDVLIPQPSEGGAPEDGAPLPRYLLSAYGEAREFIGRRRDGSVIPVELTVSEMNVGDARRFIGIIRDITERKQQMAALEYQALHDALTELPNRTLLHDRLEQAIRIARREGRPLALMIADLDHFKEINDSLGHHNGDVILQQVSSRMTAIIRSSDTVARLGGDEFAFLLPTADGEQARRIASKVVEALEQPFELQGHVFMLGASIGIAMFPDHGDDASTLMRCADVAMYAAKREHRGYAVYSDEQNQHSLQHLSLLSELRTALDSDQLSLCYQPVVDVQSGKVTGVEALARWRHPTRGILYPDDFIPLAERTGLIRSLTLWVLETAARDCREWSELGLELRVAVNLSVHNLHDADFPDHINRIIGTGTTPATRLRLEITESAVMPGPARALDVLNRLSAQGVRVSIDDFGTGYSSLSYLKQLPVDEIKIDKSFVTGMALDANDAVIVRSTIDLAHNMGLRVVAEGVEDRATYDMLVSLHCDAVQGYYVSTPLGGRELLEWLRGTTWEVAQSGH